MVTRMRPSLRGALHQPHMQRTARQIVAVQAHSCPAMLLASYQTRPISGGVKMVSCSSLGPRNRLHITCNAGSTAQSLSSSSGKGSVVLIDDSALCDTSGIVVGTAWLAAIQLWPGHIVGSAALYLSKARAILPVLNQPFEAVILMRLMADEGVIGSRSSSGREGPVVGRKPRSCRPMQLAEIAEHWDTVMDSCLLRWALEAKSSRMQLTEDARSAYTAAQAQLLLARRSTHGTTSLPCTGPASTSTSGTSPLQRQSSAYGVETGGGRPSLERSSSSDSTRSKSSSRSNSSSRLGSSDVKTEPGMQLSTAAEAAFRTGHVLTLARQEAHSQSLATSQQALKQDAQQPESADDAHVLVAVLLCEEVGPMRTAVDAVRGSTQQLYITSSLPQEWLPPLLSACGLEDSGVQLMHAPDLQVAIQRVQQQQSQGRPLGASSIDTLHIITGSLARLQSLVNVTQASTGQGAPASSTEARSAEASDNEQTSLQTQLHLAEWSCANISFKAKALSLPGVGLMSEAALAELLGVSDCRLVMDGVAW